MNKPAADANGPRRLWLIGAVALGLCTIVIGCGKRPDPPDEPPGEAPYTGPAWFRNVSAGSGLDFTFRNGQEAGLFTILEMMGGGVALLDFDGDGLLDIFVTGGGTFDGLEKKKLRGTPCKLFKNLGGFKFKDITREAGLDRVDWWYTQGAAVADFDCDGFPDLLVTGFGRIALLRNAPDGKSGRRFDDVTASVGLKDDSWSTSAGFADLDGDGWPDLYVCHYVDWSFANDPACEGYVPGVPRDVCTPQRFKPLKHALFRNEKGKFRDVSAEHGFKATGSGLGVVLVDINDDQKPDIFVANDGNDRFLFVNRGGRLEEKGSEAGIARDDNGHPNGSMGIDAADFDGSGRASLWVTNYQGEAHGLIQNLGCEIFNHQSRRRGITAISMNTVAFGTGFLDLDNDGWEDLVFVNGHVLYRPKIGTFKQLPVLLLNVSKDGQRHYREISDRGGDYFRTLSLGRGLAVGDLDNDGWPDFVVSHLNAPVAILRNEVAASQAKPHRWIGVKLSGRDHRDLIGSTVILEGSTRKMTRFAKGGRSYLSAGEDRILFGLGAAEEVRRISVKWSWGKTESWTGLEPGHYWELQEGGAKKRLEYPSR